MTKTAQNFASLVTNKKTYYIFLLFMYFGSMTIPEWFYRFIPLSFIWVLSSLIVALVLVVIGIWGIIGFFQSKVNKGQVASKYISFVLISVVGLLAFGLSY
jgi:flagellar biogenesis protein FliO